MRNNALMTSTEVGHMLGKSSSTVRRLTKSGELRCVQTLPGPNGAFLYDRADVLRYAAELADREHAKAVTA